MSSSSIFSNRVVRTRSVLQRHATNHKSAAPISCASNDVGERRNQRSWQCPKKNIFPISQQLQHTFRVHGRCSTNSQQQTMQLLLKDNHHRLRGFSSSSAAAHESSSLDSRSESDNKEEIQESPPTSKRDIDQNAIENKRRKVKDVSLIDYQSSWFDIVTIIFNVFVVKNSNAFRGKYEQFSVAN